MHPLLSLSLVPSVNCTCWIWMYYCLFPPAASPACLLSPPDCNPAFLALSMQALLHVVHSLSAISTSLHLLPYFTDGIKRIQRTRTEESDEGGNLSHCATQVVREKKAPVASLSQSTDLNLNLHTASCSNLTLTWPFTAKVSDGLKSWTFDSAKSGTKFREKSFKTVYYFAFWRLSETLKKYWKAEMWMYKVAV